MRTHRFSSDDQGVGGRRGQGDPKGRALLVLLVVVLIVVVAVVVGLVVVVLVLVLVLVLVFKPRKKNTKFCHCLLYGLFESTVRAAL